MRRQLHKLQIFSYNKGILSLPTLLESLGRRPLQAYLEFWVSSDTIQHSISEAAHDTERKPCVIDCLPHHGSTSPFTCLLNTLALLRRSSLARFQQMLLGC